MTLGEWDDAFSYCSNLTSIVVATENPKFDSRNDCNAIIETETNKLIVGCNTSTIPAGIVVIADSAFASCKDLTSIVIPDGVINLGYNAFYGCTGLTEVSIPNGVMAIKSSTFRSCI